MSRKPSKSVRRPAWTKPELLTKLKQKRSIQEVEAEKGEPEGKQRQSKNTGTELGKSKTTWS